MESTHIKNTISNCYNSRYTCGIIHIDQRALTILLLYKRYLRKAGDKTNCIAYCYLRTIVLCFQPIFNNILIIVSGFRNCKHIQGVDSLINTINILRFGIINHKPQLHSCKSPIVTYLCCNSKFFIFQWGKCRCFNRNYFRRKICCTGNFKMNIIDI